MGSVAARSSASSATGGTTYRAVVVLRASRRATTFVSHDGDANAETLSEEVLQSFGSLAARRRNLAYPPMPSDESEQVDPDVESRESDRSGLDREAAASPLRELATIERQPTPVRQVLDALSGRVPDVAFFAEKDRELARDYVVARPRSCQRSATCESGTVTLTEPVRRYRVACATVSSSRSKA